MLSPSHDIYNVSPNVNNTSFLTQINKFHHASYFRIFNDKISLII